MTPSQILIVHPDASTQSLLASMLQSLGHGIEMVANDPSAVRRLERGGIQLVISAVDPADPDALEYLSYHRRKQSGVPLLMLFADPTCDRAREAARFGASILRNPCSATELRSAVTQSLHDWREVTPPSLRTNGPASIGAHPPEPKGSNGSRPIHFIPDHRTEPRPSVQPVIGAASALRMVLDLAATVAPTRTPVAIVGEQGTGKSMVARLIHQASPRVDRPFVEVVCGGLDEAHLERELFGQSFGRGEAAGMLDRPGKIARADGGTIFLDEVAALTPKLQRQLLRLIQDGEFEAVNATEPTRADVRIILASHEDLPTLVEQGRFRRDLYDRVGVVCLKLPALRDRGGDVEALAEHFRSRFSVEFSKPLVGFTPEALDLLARHDWPGNVRELESVIQRGVALCQGTRITPANLSLGFGPPRPGRVTSHAPRPHLSSSIRPLKEALEEPEKQIIIQALQALNWNRQETARVLDINRTTLYKKMKKYGLLLDEPAVLN